MHFLYPKEVAGVRVVKKPWASATVKLTKKGHKPELTIQFGIHILKIGAELVRLPDRATLKNEEGETVKPEKGYSYWVSVGSIDPMHAVTQLTAEQETEILG